jgi:acyl-coenzyme A synthetase/AMP-(fatty) acid ligase
MAFFESIERYQDAPALIDETGAVISYRQLITEADSLAGKIGRRCLVFVMCRNCPESVIGYVGFLRNSIVPVMVNDGIAPSLLQDLLEQYHPQYFYLPAEHSLDITGTVVHTMDAYSLLELTYDADYPLNADLGVLLTTSGSTGSPKLVRQSYQNLKANTDSIIEYLGITAQDRAITTLPMSYTYGLSILQTHLYKGAAVIVTNASLMEQRFWALFKEQRATTFGGVPYTYEILKKLHFDRLELPSVRYITQAGGKLPKELAVEFITLCAEKHIKFIIMYGQTEATARMSYLPWETALLKAGSIGIAIPGGRFWLEDNDGKIIEAADIPGELLYQGGNVTLGYAETRFDLDRGDDNGGILHTGDMAKRDTEGFYYVVGRKKRFLKLFGNRINLDEVEGILNKEGIGCACSGEDDNLRIYVTSQEDIEKATQCITAHTGINRGGFKVVFISEIPRNESGKVLYSALP